MTLSLPADLERFADDYDQLTSPAVYVLELSKPANPGEEWDAIHDVRPGWWDSFKNSTTVLYVGGAKNALSRLETHRDNDDPEKKDAGKEPVLMELCRIQGLRGVFFYESADEAFLRESQHAIELDNETPESTFVRSA